MGKERKWLWEFSKRIVVMVALLFAIVTAFVMVEIHIGRDSSTLDTIATMIADVFKWTVVAYAVKAGFENVTKIHRQGEQEKHEEDGIEWFMMNPYPAETEDMDGMDRG